MIVEDKSTDHNGHSYIMRETKMDRMITCNTRVIQKTQIMAEQ